MIDAMVFAITELKGSHCYSSLKMLPIDENFHENVIDSRQWLHVTEDSCKLLWLASENIIRQWFLQYGDISCAIKLIVQSPCNPTKKISKNSEKNLECASQPTSSIYKISGSNSSSSILLLSENLFFL